MARMRRTFSPEFRLQVVRLFENGKTKSEVVLEYDLSPSVLNKLVNELSEHKVI